MPTVKLIIHAYIIIFVTSMKWKLLIVEIIRNSDVHMFFELQINYKNVKILTTETIHIIA